MNIFISLALLSVVVVVAGWLIGVDPAHWGLPLGLAVGLGFGIGLNTK